MPPATRLLIAGLSIPTFLLAALVAWSWLRPNRAQVAPGLVAESWAAVADGRHNSNTDMIEWEGDLLLVHDSRPYHLGSPDARLVIRRSPDGHHWKTLATLGIEGKDIRDPKLAVIGGRLHLYALPNSGKAATPESTVLATSEDGIEWTDFEPVGPPGWLFWRPKSPDGGRTWYVSAYWNEHGRSMLLRSEDGVAWDEVSIISEGFGNDETAIEFLPDGRLLATLRLEMKPDTLFGHPEGGTGVAIAAPPFETWSLHVDHSTRLDGPRLFSIDGQTYAVARRQPPPFRSFLWPGSTIARRRTAVYRVEPDRIVALSDLPSGGDTSYAGVVRRNDELYVDYYTSRIDRDPPWIFGMFMASDIRMVRIPIAALEARSAALP